jgi:Glycosyl transferase family 2
MSMLWSDDVFESGLLWPSHAAYLYECDRAFASEVRLVQNFRGFASKAPTVVCVVRNEALRIQAFIEHYVDLGAAGIHLIDNGSTDATVAIAAKCSPLVTIWQTSASYAKSAYGQMWSGGLVRQLGLGTWVLNVDADEFLVYEGMEEHGLADLQALLIERRQTRLRTPLIDTYSGPDVVATEDASPLQQAPYFDALPQAWSPTESPDLPVHFGPRARMMQAANTGHRPALQKVALARWDHTTAYANIHKPYPFAENPIASQGALLHFKFLRDFATKVREALADGEHWRDALEYRLYREWLAAHDLRELYDVRHSRRYSGPRSLIEAGLLQRLNWPR